MDERAEDARRKTKALQQLLASGATPDALFEAASNARLALEFRASDRMIGLDAVDSKVLAALRAATRKALVAAAAKAHVDAALELAQWTFDERDEATAPEAVRVLGRIADGEKSGRAHRLLGYFAFHGLGCAIDRVASFEHHKKAASCGDADAMFELYAMLAQGIGAAQDDAQALVWCKRAAEGGNARAMANLGGFYATGRGVPRDDALAVGWYRRAAEAGHGKAAAILGVMFALGQGAPKEPARARAAFERAEDLG
ncbi:MAG TPA: tetratricopeptide repeat protein, partial [Labilithrix sp.]